MNTICFFNSTKTWGGGEKWHFEMSQHLRRRGYRVLLITGCISELKDRSYPTGILQRCLPVSGWSVLNPFKLYRLARCLRKQGVGTIILNDPKDLKVAGFAARLAGVRRIIYRRGSAIPVRNTILNRWIFRNLVDDIISNSDTTALTILENNAQLFDKKRIHTIYNGIDLEVFDGLVAEPLLHAKDNEIVIGNAGRLTPQKGQHYLLEVAALLKARGTPFRMLIAGKGELAEELQESAKAKGLAAEVTFTGFLKNTKSLMLASDIFAFPSLWEGFGYVLAEAMACSKPVVAFDISSNPEIIADGKTGFLVEPFDVEAFADKIETLARDASLRKKMGEAGRERVEELFNKQKAASLLEELIMQ